MGLPAMGFCSGQVHSVQSMTRVLLFLPVTGEVEIYLDLVHTLCSGMQAVDKF